MLITRKRTFVLLFCLFTSLAITTKSKANAVELITNNPITISVAAAGTAVASKLATYIYSAYLNKSLFKAVEEGDIEKTKSLLKSKFVNVDATTGNDSRYERTLFEEATENKKSFEAIAMILIENGMDIHKTSGYDKSTPLHFAAKMDSVKVAETLINKDADVNVENNYKITPLHLAAENGSMKIVNLLIDKNADVNAKEKYNKTTPLHRAAENGYFEIAKVLVEKGADVNAVSNNRVTPLHLAAKNGHFKIAKLLLEKDALVNAIQQVKYCYNESNLNTPLHYAAKIGHEKMVKLFLDQEDIELFPINDNNETPFKIAQNAKALTIMKLLLEKAELMKKVDASTIKNWVQMPVNAY